MNIYGPSEIKQELGKSNIFSKSQKLIPVLHFESTDHRFSEFNELPFGIIALPKGLKFYGRGKTIGIKFDEIKGYTIGQMGDALAIDLHSISGKNILLGCTLEHLKSVIPFFRSLDLQELKDTRPEQEIKLSIQEEIEALKKSDARPIVLDKKVVDGHGFGNVNTLNITGNLLSWRGQTFDLSTAYGFKSGRFVTQINNTKTSELYNIWIYPKDKGKPFHIKFTGIVGSMDNHIRIKMSDEFLNSLNMLLWNIINFDKTIEWLDKFKNEEEVNFNEFKLTRKGIITNPKRNPTLMHWDELMIYPGTLIRWPYNNTTFISLDDGSDTRVLPITALIYWMQESEDRLFAFCGKPYYGA